MYGYANMPGWQRLLLALVILILVVLVARALLS
jgi:hypothetical protein